MRKIYLIGILMLLTIMAGALGDFIAPASSGIMRGGTYNVTFNTSLHYAENCTLSIGSVDTDNVSANYPKILNTSLNTSAWNITINTSGLEDDDSYSLTVMCENSTSKETLSRAGITIDNTVPSAPTNLSTTKRTSSSFTLTTVVNSSLTSGCSISYQTAGHVLEGTEPTCTHSGATCSCIVTNAKEYKYTYLMTATDGLNSSSSSTATFDVEFEKGGNTYAGQQLMVKKTTQPATTQATAKVSGFFQNLVNFFRNLFK